MSRTDHAADIAKLRSTVDSDLPDELLGRLLAADLLECHDDTGISLDTWVSAREFVERHIGHTIKENHV